MSTEKTEVRFADLPLISTLPKAEMKQAKEALEELDAIQQLIADHTVRETELKAELAKLQAQAGTVGLRFGELCFVDRTMPGRSSLNTTKLMEVAGVTPEQLKECTTTGKPYSQKTFKNLSRKSSESKSEPAA